MKRLAWLWLPIVLAAGPVAGQTLYISQDVPTDPGTGVNQLPWQAWFHTGGSYGLELNVPGDPDIDAVHKMDRPGNWLFSVETPNEIAGLLGGTAFPRDVIRFDPVGGYNFFFCGGSVAGPVPPTSNVDAIYLDTLGADSGDLMVSFDVPTSIGGTTFEPADLVRYEKTGPTCSSWQLSGLEFDASAAGAGIASRDNVIGADETPDGKIILVLDVPVDLAPSLGPPTYSPGLVAEWDPGTGTFDLFDSFAGWPLASEVDALSCQANPGRVPLLLVDRSTTTAGDLTLTWTPSCSSGAETHVIYEGTFPIFPYSHTKKDCLDNLGDYTEDLTPPAGSAYYLVVPVTAKDEGTYGARFVGGIFTDRPQPALVADRCVEHQTLTACP